MRLQVASKSAQGQTKNLTAERLINLYPEIAPSGAISRFELLNTPGLRSFRTYGSGPIRAFERLNDVDIVVSGGEVYLFDGTLIGDGIPNLGPVSTASNGVTAVIVEPSSGRAFSTDGVTLSEILDPDYPGATSVDYLDGYFVFSRRDSGQFFVSRLFSTDIDALDFATAESSPDKLLSVLVDHRELWLFGEETVEVWVNQGTTDFPFGRIDGALNEKGCIARMSPAQIDNSVFWLDKDGIVRRAEGYVPLRISTHAIERRIFEGRPEDAEAFTYTQDGHEFYALTVPDSGTFVYDAATREWHERESYQRNRWRVCCVLRVGSTYYAGDALSGQVFTLALDEYQENGDFLIGTMVFPPISNDGKRFVLDHVELDLDTGTGGMVMMSTSRDGIKFSSERWVSLGAEGKRQTRVQWNRCGQYEDCHLKFSVSDAVPKGAFAAYARIRG